MDLFFTFIAIGPALLITGYEAKGQAWQIWVRKAAGWFCLITFVNLMLLYLAGWGSFDFTVLTVQFLFQYLFSSVVIIGVAELVRWAAAHARGGKENV